MDRENLESHRDTHGESARAAVPSPRDALSLTDVLPVLLLFLVLYLPFVNKAFHIDDPAFINLSGMIGWNPLQAFPVDYDYAGKVIPKLSPYEITHPLLIPYVVKIVTALFGQHERALHLTFMIFPLVALFSLMKLNMVLFPGSRRTASILALFFCTVPAFLVNAQNVMTDVPTVAFLLLAMAGFFDGVENGARGMLYLGSIALTLAIFTSYQMLAFVPLVFFYLLFRRKLNPRVTIALAIPVVIFLAWLLAVYTRYDIFPVFKSKLAGIPGNVADEIRRGLVPRTLIDKIFSILAFTGGAMVWILPLHYALRRELSRFFLVLLPLVLICHLATYRLTGYPVAANIFFSTFLALGLSSLATLIWLVRQRIRTREHAATAISLLVWVFCVIGYCIALLPFGAARYLLPAFPPALMLLVNDPAWSFTTRARRIGLSCVLGGAALFALASAFSDYNYADAYRDFAGEVKTLRSSGGNTFNVWYIGEWGMHYYLEKAGARYLHVDSTEPMVGDYVVIPEMPRLWSPAIQVQERLAFFAERRYRSWLPLRLFNGRSRAGFYAHYWGMLPFAFSNEPDEVFLVLKVVR